MKAGRSGIGALAVFVFVYLVFDNLALGIIAGLLAAGGIAARRGDGAEPGPKSPEGDGTT